MPWLRPQTRTGQSNTSFISPERHLSWIKNGNEAVSPSLPPTSLQKLRFLLFSTCLQEQYKVQFISLLFCRRKSPRMQFLGWIFFLPPATSAFFSLGSQEGKCRLQIVQRYSIELAAYSMGWHEEWLYLCRRRAWHFFLEVRGREGFMFGELAGAAPLEKWRKAGHW